MARATATATAMAMADGNATEMAAVMVNGNRNGRQGLILAGSLFYATVTFSFFIVYKSNVP